MSGQTCQTSDHSTVLAELEKIRVHGKLSRKDVAELRKVFGARFSSAWKIARQGRVKKYVFRPSGRVQWVVVGNARDYLVYEQAPYCSCDDFYMSVIDGEAKACKHLIAQKLAFELGLYEVIEEEDERYFELLQEWRKAE